MNMIKKHGILIVLILVVAGLLVALVFKSKIYDYIGSEVRKTTTEETQFVAKEYIQKHFNYQANKLNFQFTMLEFKSSGCTICKQMEPVLESLKNWEVAKVNVQVIQILNPDSQELMKFYGISAVPTHLILDKQGNEVFRKYGFVSEEEFKNIIQSKI
ncbi:thioredoxin family protein [Maribellus sediminis]|uniref:thioredoxin family protein n=1 Tax=Maribellus sediminis TaxID=2696285 RepID=UPI0014319CD8|nr:thioredoxin family protein [Maribellus sediminis]